MWKLFVFFLIEICIFLPSSAIADHQGLKKVYLSGTLQSGTSNQIKIRDIESFGLTTHHVYNPYEKKSSDYTGVWMSDFVAHLGLETTKTLVITAIDDYQIQFSRDDWETTPILLVTQVNGHYIGYAEKGPMRIVFPTLKTEMLGYSNNLPKWIWMIKSFEFKE